ncbi:UDP-N-acetylmuramyl peptide synthase [Bifidobacterium jacchi]|uniref:UDP-N-acetylmuramyl peptide synthase n=1 Tax=Bifidobacterium jacchi TaxID=2490545 RepID=A0A5N5RFE3_9BIFI|nr:UDP-N-acetylmuramyl peptide synthase [Bifidobacterium jacchi]KAB5605976.1 UDP-N-acetylmuramyl peptide synthase [Bifidobacterium jacchi]
MSAVSESVTGRITLGDLADRYGFDLTPPFAANVTITSLADDAESVSPGALLVVTSPDEADAARLGEAANRGAYAVLVPSAFDGRLPDLDIPVLYGDPDGECLGRLAAQICGSPANAMAVFAVMGTDDASIEENAHVAATLLHTLGNPVAVIGADGSLSLERHLNLRYPLGILDVESTLAVCAEDGAAAVVIALNTRTLRDGALNGVNVDVLGQDCAQGDSLERVMGQEAADRYGFVIDDQTHLTGFTEESDQLAMQSVSSGVPENDRRLSLAIAMVMAAGVRRANIRNALRVSRDISEMKRDAG